MTVAPLMGFPCSSLTVPPTRPVCAAASRDDSTAVTRHTAIPARNARRMTRAICSRPFENALERRKYNPTPAWVLTRVAAPPVGAGPHWRLPRSPSLRSRPGKRGRPHKAILRRKPAAGPFGVDSARLSEIDRLVEDAIVAGQLPGAVVLVGHRDKVVYEKAFGRRAVEPAPEPMTIDTIFDFLASLTKVVATTPAVMRLVEEGRLRLTDRVSTYIPEFGRYGKESDHDRHLPTHMSGLRPDVDLADEWQGADAAIRLAVEEVPVAPPDQRMIYSDINFFLLGEVVRRISGDRLDVFARTSIFAPLGMSETMFLPPADLVARVAPTERCTPLGWPCAGPDARMLRGVVHDPTARRMGGVAGHAGLFSTARDLTRYARALLAGGELDGAKVLSPATIARMTAPSTPPGERQVRALGWDIDSSFSSNRGELFPLGSYGHTGFTGTSIWIDPSSKTFVIFLSSRLPRRKGGCHPAPGARGNCRGCRGRAGAEGCRRGRDRLLWRLLADAIRRRGGDAHADVAIGRGADRD